MGIFSCKLTGRKDREKSEVPKNNVKPDSNRAPSPTHVPPWPIIRSFQANNKNTEHDGHVKSRKLRSSIKPLNNSEVMKLPASTNAEEVKSSSERQSYNGDEVKVLSDSVLNTAGSIFHPRENVLEPKQQGYKVKEGIGHNSQIRDTTPKTTFLQLEASHNSQIRDTTPKTTFLQLEASKDFQDVKKKREKSDTANLDGRDTPIESKNDTKNPKERPRTTSSVHLEDRAQYERIVSAKRGRSNGQGKDFLTARNDNDDNTSRSGNSARDEPIKDPGPSHFRNEADEERKGNRSLNAEPSTEDLHKKPIKKGRNKQKIKELEDHVRQLIEEKNVLLNRLSEIGAMKLINNNPNITDLSDANRPEKLVEQFSELYDNEWTDAYEHLTKTQSKPMDQSVNLLLQALKEAYKICLSSTNTKAIKLRKAMLSYVGLSDEDSIEIELQEIEKKMYEYRTKKSESNVTRVGKEVRERLRDQFKQLEAETSKSVSLYIDGCVRICWYMCIKNPPMHLDFGENEKTTTADNSKPVIRCFDKTKFMSYTKHGDYIDYVVWPAVFLHCGGSIMRKGVAQGAPVATNMLLDVMDEN